MTCLLWWKRDGKLDEKDYVNPKTLLRKFGELVADGKVSVVMAEVHKP